MFTGMTALLDQALTKVRRLPGERQDELARMLLAAAGSDDACLGLTQAQADEVENRLQNPDDLLSMDEVRAHVSAWLK